MQQSSTTLRLLHAQMCYSVVLGTWFVQTSGNTAVTRQSEWSYGVCVCVDVGLYIGGCIEWVEFV